MFGRQAGLRRLNGLAPRGKLEISEKGYIIIQKTLQRNNANVVRQMKNLYGEEYGRMDLISSHIFRFYILTVIAAVSCYERICHELDVDPIDFYEDSWDISDLFIYKPVCFTVKCEEKWAEIFILQASFVLSCMTMDIDEIISCRETDISIFTLGFPYDLREKIASVDNKWMHIFDKSATHYVFIEEEYSYDEHGEVYENFLKETWEIDLVTEITKNAPFNADCNFKVSIYFISMLIAKCTMILQLFKISSLYQFEPLPSYIGYIRGIDGTVHIDIKSKITMDMKNLFTPEFLESITNSFQFYTESNFNLMLPLQFDMKGMRMTDTIESVELK